MQSSFKGGYFLGIFFTPGKNRMEVIHTPNGNPNAHWEQMGQSIQEWTNSL